MDLVITVREQKRKILVPVHHEDVPQDPVERESEQAGWLQRWSNLEQRQAQWEDKDLKELHNWVDKAARPTCSVVSPTQISSIFGASESA